MAEGNNEFKTLKKTKMDFDSLYEQIQEGCPVLKENKEFWTRKGNSQKVTCSLCNIGVELSKNTNVLKSALLNHIENKFHKKRYEAFLTPDTKSSKQDYEKQAEFNYEEKPEDNHDMGKKRYEAFLTPDTKSSKQDYEKQAEFNYEEKPEDNHDMGKIINQFENIYDSFSADDPVVNSSKQYLKKRDGDENYFCTLCKQTIIYSDETKKFRYNLWLHMNEDTHREKLPNYNEVIRKFKGTMSYLSKVIPAKLVEDVEYFAIGPINKFVKCSICEIAVHAKPDRLITHMQGVEHKSNKKALQRKPEKIRKGTWKEPKNTLAQRTLSDCNRLKAKINSKFKEELISIEPGKMPGYVVCSACCKPLLPGKFCIEAHITERHGAPASLPTLREGKSKKLCEAISSINEKPDGKKLRVVLNRNTWE